jgi:hypothetical protein
VQVRHDEGVANHIGPEPCAVVRKDGGEASVGERTGQPLSLAKIVIPGADAVETPLEIASLARMHTKKAVKTLAAIMNEPHAPYSARVAAAEALLDRGWGKPRRSHEAEITHRYVIEIPALMDNATWEAEALEHEPDNLQ